LSVGKAVDISLKIPEISKELAGMGTPVMREAMVVGLDENVLLAANHADPRRSGRPLHRTGPVEAFRP
jgi:hypothetical protein